MAYTKKNASANENVEANDNDVENTQNTQKVEKVEKVERSKQEKKYKPEDAILCHSMFPGTLLFTGDKSKMTYEFSNIGDTRWIEYQDLFAALLTRKKSLFAPYIIIDDEELLEGRYWQDLKKVYDGMYSKEDLLKIISLPTSKFNDEFKKLPVGFKKTIASIVSEMIARKDFDSMNKIKIIDEDLNLDLKLLVE